MVKTDMKKLIEKIDSILTEGYSSPPPFSDMIKAGGGDIEVGDKIRTKKMSMIGIVRKIKPSDWGWSRDEIHFWVNGPPARMMMTVRSNCVKMMEEDGYPFAGEKRGQKPGDKWRGTDPNPPGNKLVGGESTDPTINGGKKDIDLDSILQGLSRSHRTIMNFDAYTPETKSTVDRIYRHLRGIIMNDDPATFKQMWHYLLGKYPDAFEALTDPITNIYPGNMTEGDPSTKFLGTPYKAESEGDGEQLADLTKIRTNKLRELYALHRYYGQKDPRSKASANRIAAELKRRGVNIPMDEGRWWPPGFFDEYPGEDEPGKDDPEEDEKEVDENNYTSGEYSQDEQCPNCGGSGIDPFEGDTCPECGGNGWVTTNGRRIDEPYDDDEVDEGEVHQINPRGHDLTSTVNKVMTPDEYRKSKDTFPPHSVTHNVDGFGNVGVRYDSWMKDIQDHLDKWKNVSEDDDSLEESLKAAFEDYVKNTSTPAEEKKMVTITYTDGHKQTKSCTPKEIANYKVSPHISKVEPAADSKSRLDDTTVSEAKWTKKSARNFLQGYTSAIKDKSRPVTDVKPVEDEPKKKEGQKSPLTKVSEASSSETNAAEMKRFKKNLKDARANHDDEDAHYWRMEIRKLKGEMELRARDKKGSNVNEAHGGFGGSPSQAQHEIEWLEKKIESLTPLLAKKPSVARQIKDLQRQIRERELAISFKTNEAKGENRELWDRVRSKGTVRPIDRERYTDLSYQGLEGPFSFKNGKVLYYDPKEGKYYDRDTDTYVDNDMIESSGNQKLASLKEELHHADTYAQTIHLRMKINEIINELKSGHSMKLDEFQYSNDVIDKQLERLNYELKRAKGVEQVKFIKTQIGRLQGLRGNPKKNMSSTDDIDEDAASNQTNLTPTALQLARIMTPDTRDQAFEFIDHLRGRFGKEYALQVYKAAQKYRKLGPHSKGIGEDTVPHKRLEGPYTFPNGQVLYYDTVKNRFFDPKTKKFVDTDNIDVKDVGFKQGMEEDNSTAQPPPIVVAPNNQQQPTGNPIPGQPQSTAQQAPAPKGVPTAPTTPGQPPLPTAGQPGGAPVALRPGTPTPPMGSAANKATTPVQTIATGMQQLAQPGSNVAAGKIAQALANIK